MSHIPIDFGRTFDTCEDVQSTTEQLKLVLEKGGFTLKVFTIPGSDPSINRNGLDFGKKICGRKLSNIQGVILKILTMHNCVGGGDF